MSANWDAAIEIRDAIRELRRANERRLIYDHARRIVLNSRTGSIAFPEAVEIAKKELHEVDLLE
jgi:flagellar basal body P-ring protein FlgI